MLEVADVCILCGEVHPSRHYGLRHGERGECPKVIMGRFPLLTRGNGDDGGDEEPLVGTASQRIREYETPSVPAPSRQDSYRRMNVDSETRARTMGMAWLPPPDLGAVI